jgi:hypothetical protein
MVADSQLTANFWLTNWSHWSLLHSLGMDCIENPSSNNACIVACMCFAMVVCLLGCCLGIDATFSAAIQPFRHDVTIHFFTLLYLVLVLEQFQMQNLAWIAIIMLSSNFDVLPTWKVQHSQDFTDIVFLWLRRFSSVNSVNVQGL